MAAIAALALCSPATAEAAFDCTDNRAAVLTTDGIVEFKVEIANGPAERARGLMYRDNLPAGSGMLFVYDAPREVSFWMRNTFIPLDLIFVDETGTIRHIHPNARPMDDTPIPGATTEDPQPERQLVLEIGGGESARLGLAPGQTMASSQLDRAKAAWPCG